MKSSTTWICLLACLAASNAPAAQGRLRVEVGSGVACVDVDRLEAALSRQLGRSGALRAERLVVEAPSAHQVSVRLVALDGGLVGQRLLEVEDADCKALPDTIALMVEAWLAPSQTPARPSHPSNASAREGVPPPLRQLPQPDAEVSISETLPPPPDEAAKQPEAPATPPGQVVPDLALVPPPMLAAEPPPPGAGIENAPKPAHQLALAALGGGYMLGSGSFFGFQGGGQLTWRLGQRWGASLLVQLHSSVGARLSSGAVHAEDQSFDLCAEFRIPVTQRSTVNVLLGPTLHRLAAWDEGFSPSSSVTLYDPGVSGIVQWEWSIVSGLYATIGIRAGLRLHDDELRVGGPSGPATVLTVPAFRLSGLLGLGWRLL
ncbi:MAG TPA: hypothetical protein VGK67_07125 [Myxococcales bacterium]